MASFKIAAGRNNTANLKRVDQLSAPLFNQFKGDGEWLLTEFHDNVITVMDGARNYVDVGLPYAIVTFTLKLTRAEFAYLKATFTGAVTVTLLNQGDATYHNYNANLKIIRAGSDSGKWQPDALGAWDEVKLQLNDLELI